MIRVPALFLRESKLMADEESLMKREGVLVIDCAVLLTRYGVPRIGVRALVFDC